MSEPETSSGLHMPVLLLRNVTYPTYQLHAFAGNGKAPPGDVLTICVLETLGWLRRRFRAFEIPRELDWPEAEDYQKVKLRDFCSFSVNRGYKVEAVSLPEEGIWTLQITEPDLGPDPGAEEQRRLPVPGRVFETNVAYRLQDGQVECAFLTLVSEPVGTTADCEVFRLAPVRRLAEHPLVGLRHEWPLDGSVFRLEDERSLGRLHRWLGHPERMLPALVLAQCPPEYPCPAMGSALAGIDSLLLPQRPAELPGVAVAGPGWPLEAESVARKGIGFAQVFALPLARCEAFRKITGRTVDPGEAVFYEPSAFGGEVRRFSPGEIRSDPAGIARELLGLIQSYPKKKPMRFGDMPFLADAKELDRGRLLRESRSREEMLCAFEDKLQAVRDRHRGELQAAEAQTDEKERKIASLKDRIDALEREKKALAQNAEALKTAHADALRDMNRLTQWRRSVKQRPQSPEKIADWAEERFGECILFHSRARGLLKDVSLNKYDLELLCDAVEFLAVDFRDRRLGEISEEEMHTRCSMKYNRPFCVSSTKSTSVERYPKEYKIKYYPGYNGEPVESLLDLHLTVGNDSDNHLRIYFLFDGDNKRVVIGSLPDHLPTVSF